MAVQSKTQIRSASVIVAEKLRERIQSGRLRPGTKLVIDQIAAEFGVSRTPVREALQRLEVEGLVTIEPRRGTTVTEISLEDLEKLYEVRLVLENLAAERVMQHITDRDIALLEKLLADARKQMAREKEFARLRRTNREFHETLYRATNNPYLEEILRNLRDRSWRYIAPAIRLKQGLKDSPQAHAEILEALKARDLPRLQRAIARDLMSTMELVRKMHGREHDCGERGSPDVALRREGESDDKRRPR